MTIDDIRRLREIVEQQQQAIDQMQRTIDDALSLLEPAIGALNKLAPRHKQSLTLEEFAERGLRAQKAVDGITKRGRKKKSQTRRRRQDRTVTSRPCQECERSNGPHYRGRCDH